jgi:hypothetical protein
MAARQPNSRASRDWDHRRRLLFASALISADTVEASTGPLIRIRPPVANSISITPALSGDGDGTIPGSGVATATGLTRGLSIGKLERCLKLHTVKDVVRACILVTVDHYSICNFLKPTISSPLQQSVPSPPATIAGDAAPT